MDKSIRVSGKTVNDAIMNAAIELKTSSDGIDYKVIERESRGFLGIGAKDALIEAWIREPEKSGEPVSAQEGSEDSSSRDLSSSAQAEKKVSGKKGGAADQAGSASGAAGSVSGTAGSVSGMTGSASGTAGSASGTAGFASGTTGSASGMTASGKRETYSYAASSSAQAGEKKVSEDSEEDSRSRYERKNSDIKVLDDPSEAIERAEKFLKDVFASIGMEVSITSDYDGECLNISMEGDEMGLLIGKRGQTLDSLQYLTSLIVNKGKPYYVRVKLDTENYRERRKATLENLARNIAIKVKKTRQTVYLEPMNPYERRIIHSALQNDPFVTTHSEGEEPDRKVVVTLKKDADLEALERKYGERRRGGYRQGRGYGRGGRGGRGGYGHGGRYNREGRDYEDRGHEDLESRDLRREGAPEAPKADEPQSED